MDNHIYIIEYHEAKGYLHISTDNMSIRENTAGWKTIGKTKCEIADNFLYYIEENKLHFSYEETKQEFERFIRILRFLGIE